MAAGRIAGLPVARLTPAVRIDFAHYHDPVLSPGDVLNGRYQLTQRIAAGGMGEVWRGNDLLLHRDIAVKVLLPALMSDADFITRFRSEARMMAALRHPGIVQVYDYGENAEVGAHRLDYLVMEYIDGTPLSKKIQQAGRLDAAETMTVVAQVADALHTAHEAGIVHRDVKPSNLLVRPAGAIVLVDFGVARSTGITGITGTNVVLGSAHYMAPEQAEGRPVTAATDVYALGAVAFSCLTGRPPYVGDNPLAVLAQLVHGQPPVLPPDVPPAVASVVLRALAKDPSRRFPSASALAAAARGAASAPGVGVPGGTRLPYGSGAGPSAAPTRGPATAAHRPPGPVPPRPAASPHGQPYQGHAPNSRGPASPYGIGVSGAAPVPPARPGAAGTGVFAAGSARVGGPAPGHVTDSVSSRIPAAAVASPAGRFEASPSGATVQRRRATVALAAVAVVAVLAGVGIILSNRSDGGTPTAGSPAGDLPGDRLQTDSGKPRGQTTTRPGSRRPSPKGGAGTTTTGSDDQVTTGPGTPADPAVTADPQPSDDSGSTTPVTNPHDDPVALCGGGYTVIDSKTLQTSAGVPRGTVHLLRRATDETNCVVTIKADSLGRKTATAAVLEVQGGATKSSKGSFQYYAGPVTAAASPACIRWGGAIGGLTFLSEWSHCG